MRGVSHGDLKYENIGVNERGEISCFDFDQAVAGHPLECLFRDFLGFSIGGYGSKISILGRLKHVNWIAGAARLYSAAKRSVLGQQPYCDWETLNMRCRLSQDPLCIALYDSWKKAAKSDANSPGMGKTYYSLDYRGIHFPGERPWAYRWEMIERKVSFCGKRFVELGCNMSLLAIHAALYGAEKCTAVDINERVLDAAATLSKAFSTEISYHKINFDSSEQWEEKLRNHDIASALLHASKEG